MADPTVTSKSASGAGAAVPGGPDGNCDVTVMAKPLASRSTATACTPCRNVRPRFQRRRPARRGSSTPVATGADPVRVVRLTTTSSRGRGGPLRRGASPLACRRRTVPRAGRREADQLVVGEGGEQQATSVAPDRLLQERESQCPRGRGANHGSLGESVGKGASAPSTWSSTQTLIVEGSSEAGQSLSEGLDEGISGVHQLVSEGRQATYAHGSSGRRRGDGRERLAAAGSTGDPSHDCSFS